MPRKREMQMAFNAVKKCPLVLKEMQIKMPSLSLFWLLGISNIRKAPRRLLMRTRRKELSCPAAGRMADTAQEGI